MFDFDYYSGRDLMYPSLIKKPRLGSNATAQEHREYADLLKQYEKDNQARKAAVAEYNNAVAVRLEEFKNKLRDDYDLTQGQFDIIWMFAWERGHSYGLQEVYHHFEEFYEMATKFAEAK